MGTKSKLKAEDLLIDEGFIDKVLLNNIGNDKRKSEEDVMAARQIYSFLTAPRQPLSDSEKEQLKYRIKQSVRKIKKKKQIRKWSAAAAILIIGYIGAVWYQQFNSTPEIVSFAQNMRDASPDNDTRLVLQNGREVHISKEESHIKYEKNGENISIGAEQKVVQELKPEKPVFNTVIVPYGKRTQITLSEGTKVWLNSGSRLVYPAVFSKNKREVYVDGEAVFEVTHSDIKPFLVSTRDFDIQVLGTVFNVSAYSDDKYSNTVLERGAIELSYKGNFYLSKERLSISPGTMVVFDPDQKTFQQKQVDPENYLSWRKGYYVFKSEKLENILKKLARYYNVEIILQYSQLAGETFSGSLDLKNTPEEVLKVINRTTPFSFRYENEKLIINHNHLPM